MCPHCACTSISVASQTHLMVKEEDDSHWADWFRSAESPSVKADQKLLENKGSSVSGVRVYL